jgi:hypothetical protein
MRHANKKLANKQKKCLYINIEENIGEKMFTTLDKISIIFIVIVYSIIFFKKMNELEIWLQEKYGYYTSMLISVSIYVLDIALTWNILTVVNEWK